MVEYWFPDICTPYSEANMELLSWSIGYVWSLLYCNQKWCLHSSLTRHVVRSNIYMSVQHMSSAYVIVQFGWQCDWSSGLRAIMWRTLSIEKYQLVFHIKNWVLREAYCILQNGMWLIWIFRKDSMDLVWWLMNGTRKFAAWTMIVHIY